MTGITNVTVEKLTEEENYDLKRSFVGIFLSNSVTLFINFYWLKGSTYTKHRQKHSTRYTLVE